MKQINLSIVNETFLESYLASIDINSIKTKLSDIKYKKITDKLELLIKADLTTIKRYLNIKNYYTDTEKKEIEKAFNYSAHRQKDKFMEHFRKLNIKSCPFCNNNYVYFYKKDAGKYNTLSTLEHYYPKAVYPHLSLSFFNLIPCCSTCNSKFKGNSSHIGNIIHPYYEDFDEKTAFNITVNSSIIKKDEDINVNLKSSDSRCIQTIDRFKLDKIYEEHRDIAKEIWNKAQIYNESRIDELYKEFYKKLGYTKEDVKNMIFCNYLHKDDINRRNHSKLTQDILKQFELKE